MKLITIDKAKQLRDEFKSQGKTVVTINGSFDIIHIGHILTLKQAKSQGDILILGLNSDISILSYKGIKPIFDENARVIMLSAIEYIDYIVLFDEANPIKFLDEIKPDIHCNAASYGEDCVEAQTVKKNGGKIYLISDDIGDGSNIYSTTNVVNEIVRRWGSKEKIKVVFLDRDGVINVDTGYTHKTEDLKLTENCVEGLRKFREMGFRLIIITNQSGIARGYYDEHDMHKFNSLLLEMLNKENVKIDKIYFCPHHPDITGECDCRKPRFMNFSKAKKEFNIDMGKSVSIGDKDADTIAAKNAGVAKTILIKSDNYEQKEKADFVVKDLLEAANSIENVK